MPFLSPNQQHQSTEGKIKKIISFNKLTFFTNMISSNQQNIMEHNTGPVHMMISKQFSSVYHYGLLSLNNF